MRKTAIVLLAGLALAAPGSAQVNPFPKTHDMMDQAAQINKDSRSAGDPTQTTRQPKPKPAPAVQTTAAAPAKGQPAASAAVSPELALVRSAGYGKIDEVKAKLDAGASLQTHDNEGHTMLHAAASKGKLEMVQFLLAQKGIEIDAVDKTGATPLIAAAAAGKTDVVKELLQKGADFKLKNGEGQNALHRAAANGYPMAVRALLAAGSDPAETDSKGKTALELDEHYHQNQWQAVQTEIKGHN